MDVASQPRIILIRSSVESTESDSRSFTTSGFGFGALPRPPESHSYFGSCTDAVCSCILPFLCLDLAPGMIFVDFGVIFVGNDVVPREGELQLERFRQNQAFAVDTCCLDLAGIGMTCVFDLPTFCRIATIASSLGITSTLPLILEDCCEFLFFMSMTYEDDALLLIKFGGLRVITSFLAGSFFGFYATEAAAPVQNFSHISYSVCWCAPLALGCRFIANDVDVLLYLESRCSHRQGEFRFERFTHPFASGFPRRCLALWLATLVLILSESHLLLSSHLTSVWIQMLMLLYHCWVRSLLPTMFNFTTRRSFTADDSFAIHTNKTLGCAPATSLPQSREYGLVGHPIVACSTWFGFILQFLYGSQPRPPDLLCSPSFTSLPFFKSIFMSKMKVHFFPFHLEGSIRYHIPVKLDWLSYLVYIWFISLLFRCI